MTLTELWVLLAGAAGRASRQRPLFPLAGRTLPEQPFPALLAGGAGADAVVSQHRQPLRVGCQREGEFEWMPGLGVATSGKLGAATTGQPELLRFDAAF